MRRTPRCGLLSGGTGSGTSLPGRTAPVRTAPPSPILPRTTSADVREEVWQLSDRISTSRLTPLAIGVVATAVGLVLPGTHATRYAVLLLGTWLIIGALIRYVAAREVVASQAQRSIPIRFSGTLGRFRLRPRGDGRRVEVRAGEAVVAELIARDDGDELIVDFSLADEPDVEAFGTAIGLAIEMVVAADEDDDRRPRSDGPAGSSRTGGYRPLRPLGRA